MTMLDEVIKLLGVDGKGLRVIRAGEMESSHVTEECVCHGPFTITSKLRAVFEHLTRKEVQC